VSDEVQPAPPLVYEGLEPALASKSTTAEVSDAVKQAIRAIRNAMKAARKPGMPLSILSNVAREAPLGSLLIAFLLGIAVARRTRS
jgi:alpha-D-ribose 1-methylphosphonate 5-triphosphate synthase subunit PhnH